MVLLYRFPRIPVSEHVEIHMNGRFLICSDPWRLLPICTSGPRLGLERLKWVVMEVELEYSDLDDFECSGGR